MRTYRSRQGASLIDVLVSLGIVILLFGGIYMVYFSLVDAVNNVGTRTAASSAMARQIETIRNLPYESVGTVGGVPSGVLPQTQTMTVGDYTFSVQTTVRNIDDAFDGTLGGTPNDTAPADYKLIEIVVSCPTCARFVPLALTTTVAPRSLESASNNGSLFVNVFDALGVGVSAATVRVVNASVTPSIDLTDTTNSSGILQLVGVPTSTQGYQITVTKSGYSTDKTYTADGANPTPVKPHATVSAQTVTNVSFAIDRTSTLNIRSSDVLCQAVPNKTFTVSGAKLIGTPDLLKFSTTTATGVSGAVTLNGIEWDTYNLVLTGSGSDVVGTIPLFPAVVNPDTNVDFRFVLRDADPNALLVTVTDAATGALIPGASVNLSKSGFSETLVTNRSTVSQTDWSGGAYASQSGGIDTSSAPGTMKLAANASSTYSTTTVEWLISTTIDLASTTASYYAINWTPTSQPPGAGADSVRFQLATNNDNATWNFKGPDGTAGTYFTNGATLTGFNGNRYTRFKAFLSTQDETVTPSVTDVTLTFSSACTPSSQVLFSGLTTGTYTLDVTAPQYLQGTSSVSVIGAWQQQSIQLTHQ